MRHRIDVHVKGVSVDADLHTLSGVFRQYNVNANSPLQVLVGIHNYLAATGDNENKHGIIKRHQNEFRLHFQDRIAESSENHRILENPERDLYPLAHVNDKECFLTLVEHLLHEDRLSQYEFHHLSMLRMAFSHLLTQKELCRDNLIIFVLRKALPNFMEKLDRKDRPNENLLLVLDCVRSIVTCVATVQTRDGKSHAFLTTEINLLKSRLTKSFYGDCYPLKFECERLKASLARLTDTKLHILELKLATVMAMGSFASAVWNLDPAAVTAAKQAYHTSRDAHKTGAKEWALRVDQLCAETFSALVHCPDKKTFDGLKLQLEKFAEKSQHEMETYGVLDLVQRALFCPSVSSVAHSQLIILLPVMFKEFRTWHYNKKKQGDFRMYMTIYQILFACEKRELVQQVNTWVSETFPSSSLNKVGVGEAPAKKAKR